MARRTFSAICNLTFWHNMEASVCTAHSPPPFERGVDMQENFEHKLTSFAKRHNLILEWQPLKFGYKRAKIHCHSHSELNAVAAKLRRAKNVDVTGTWFCSVGEFEGYVFAMEPQEKADYEAKAKEEQARLDDWWLRYHSADTQTKRLMACGALT